MSTPNSSSGAPATVLPPPQKRSFLARLVRGLILLGLLLLVAFGLYTWATLKYVYSTGERAGYVQKFSKKGWLCKTWEGELAMVNLPGQPAELFHFTVADDNVARQIESAMGQRMSISYDQKPGIPTSCFGETPYFVTRVRMVSPQ